MAKGCRDKIIWNETLLHMIGFNIMHIELNSNIKTFKVLIFRIFNFTGKCKVFLFVFLSLYQPGLNLRKEFQFCWENSDCFLLSLNVFAHLYSFSLSLVAQVLNFKTVRILICKCYVCMQMRRVHFICMKRVEKPSRSAQGQIPYEAPQAAPNMAFPGPKWS